MATCQGCGRELTPEARYCGGCGRPTRTARQEQSRREQARGHRAQRVALSIATVFVGTIVAILVEAALDADGRQPWLSLLVRLVLFTGVGVASARLLGPGAVRRSFAGQARPYDLALGLLAGVVAFGVAWGYVQLWDLVLEPEAVAEPKRGLIVVASVVIVAPLFEEWLCRGVLFEACLRTGSVGTAVVVTSSLFALLHFLGGLFWFELPHRLLAGVIFGLLRARSGSLLPGIVAHGTLNLLAVLVE
jgi:membrane protease YdiL (CAAX protease family)